MFCLYSALIDFLVQALKEINKLIFLEKLLKTLYENENIQEWREDSFY